MSKKLPVVSVQVRNGDINRALKLFKRRSMDSGHLMELRERRYYKKPTTLRRREKQLKFNLDNNIIPVGIVKKVKDIIETLEDVEEHKKGFLLKGTSMEELKINVSRFVQENNIILMTLKSESKSLEEIFKDLTV